MRGALRGLANSGLPGDAVGMAELTPATVEEATGPIRRSLAELEELARRLQDAGPAEKQEINEAARKAALRVMGAAEELSGLVHKATR